MAKPFTQFHAFTKKFPSLTNRVITQVRVMEAFAADLDPQLHPAGIITDALWDTGATQSVVTRKTVQDLNLTPVGTMRVRHGNGESNHNTHIVNFLLPNGVGIAGVVVTELENVVDNFGVIIGMDIICQGDFALTNFNGKSCLSFRIPSLAEIDYVQEWKGNVKTAVGVNSLCPCGSGRKVKKCCAAR